MSSEIRIYVADLAAYNAGYLHGVWIDATQDMNDISRKVLAMLSSSPVEDAEEYAIHDYEGFDGYSLGEYCGLDTAHEVACFIDAHSAFGGALLDYFGGDIEAARVAAEDSYRGCYKSLADFAEELTEETSEIPPSLRYYIDYERMGRDIEMNGDVFTIETGFEEVHVFWER